MAYRELRYVYSDGTTDTVGDPRTEGIDTRVTALEGGAAVGDVELFVDADYTGASDASTAINAAIAAAAGRTVRLKPGTLRLTAPVVLAAGTRLVGAGLTQTTLKPYGDVTAITAPTNCDDMLLSDFGIDGTNQTGVLGEATPKGLYFTTARRLTVARLYVRETWATGIGIDHITGIIENCWAVGCGRQWDGQAYVERQPGSSGIGIGTGNLPPDGWESLTIVGCHTEANANYGIFVEQQSGSSYTGSGVTVIGCTAKGNGRAGIGEGGATGTRIIGNTCTGNREGVSIDHGTLGFTGGGKPGLHTLVQGNHLFGNGVGVKMYAPGTLALVAPHVAGNTIRENTGQGVLVSLTGTGTHKDVWIDGNAIYENGSHGVEVSGGQPVDRFAVTDNRVWNNTGNAIYVDTPTTKVRVTGNEAWDDQGVPTQTGGLVFDTTLTHTNHRTDVAWVEGTNTLPA